MKRQNILVFFMAVLLGTAIFEGCVNQSGPVVITATPTPEVSVIDADVVPEKHTRHLVSATTSYLSEEDIDLASPWLNSSIDNSALAAVMRKAERGEKITIATLGGSITQGTISNGSRDKEVSIKKYYAEIFFDWFRQTFPDTEVVTVNAGIGGTNSYLGVHRLQEDVMDFSPDLVLVEYSVNDGDDNFHKKSYENLVRRIYYDDSHPAVLLLFMAQSNGTSAQNVHSLVGFQYKVPMISYKNIMTKLIKDGVYTEAELAADGVHPSAVGHAITGEMLWKYLNRVYINCDDYLAPEIVTVKGSTAESFKNTEYLDCEDILIETDSDSKGFMAGKTISAWDKAWETSAGGTLTFTVKCKNLGFLFYRTTNKAYGTYEVFVDGKSVSSLVGYQEGDWGNYGLTKEVFVGNEDEEHVIVLRPKEGNEGKKFGLIRILVSH